MDIQLVAALVGLGAWLILFMYGAAHSLSNPEQIRPESRPNPHDPKER